MSANPGPILVSGRLLADITRSLPHRPVEVATEESERKAQLVCGIVQVHPADPAHARTTRRCPAMPAAAGTLAG